MTRNRRNDDVTPPWWVDVIGVSVFLALCYAVGWVGAHGGFP